MSFEIDDAAPLRLTEEEHAALIRLSSREHPLGCVFGPGWIALRCIESNKWAIRELAKMRGIT